MKLQYDNMTPPARAAVSRLRELWQDGKRHLYRLFDVVPASRLTEEEERSRRFIRELGLARADALTNHLRLKSMYAKEAEPFSNNIIWNTDIEIEKGFDQYVNVRVIIPKTEWVLSQTPTWMFQEPNLLSVADQVGELVSKSIRERLPTIFVDGVRNFRGQHRP